MTKYYAVKNSRYFSLKVDEESDISLLQEGNDNLQTTDKNNELFGYNKNINKSG